MLNNIGPFDKKELDKFFTDHYVFSPERLLKKFPKASLYYLTGHLIEFYYKDFCYRLNYNPTEDYVKYSDHFLIHSTIMNLYFIRNLLAKENNNYVNMDELFENSFEKYKDDDNPPLAGFNNFYRIFSKRWSFKAYCTNDKFIDISKSRCKHQILNFLPESFKGECSDSTKIQYKRKDNSKKTDKRPIEKQLQNLEYHCLRLITYSEIDDICDKILYYYKTEFIYGQNMIAAFLHHLHQDQLSTMKECIGNDSFLQYNKELENLEPTIDACTPVVNKLIEISLMPNVLSRNIYLDKLFDDDSLDYVTNEVLPVYEKTLLCLLLSKYNNDYEKIDIALSEIIHSRIDSVAHGDLTPRRKYITPPDPDNQEAMLWYEINRLMKNMDKYTSFKQQDNPINQQAYNLVNLYSNITPEVPHFSTTFRHMELYYTLIIDQFFRLRYTDKWWNYLDKSIYKEIFI